MDTSDDSPDDKKVMQALAATVIVDAVQSLDLGWPTVSEEGHRRNVLARKALTEDE